MLAAQQQAVDVPLAEPDRVGIGAARGRGRSGSVGQLSRHDVLRFTRSPIGLSCPVCP